MQTMRMTVFASWTLMGATLAAQSGVAFAGDTPEAKPQAAAVCEEAIVNPVSGHAECVRPMGAPVAPPPPRPPVIKLAVFDFQLDDASAAAALLGQTTSNEAVMEKVSGEARRMLAQSGRFILVDVSKLDSGSGAKSPRDCDGCEAALALQAGAEQALVGIVRRVTQTDYYVLIQITDAQTGKVLDEEDANFAGGPDGWASGVRMLIKHQVLARLDQP